MGIPIVPASSHIHYTMKNTNHFLLLGVLLTLTTGGIARTPSRALPVKAAHAATAKATNGQTKYLICHNGHQISIAAAALPAHMAHGDALGSCGVVEESRGTLAR